MHVGSYALSSSNILGLLSFSGSTTSNLVCGILSASIGFAGGFVISVLLDIAARKKLHNTKSNSL